MKSLSNTAHKGARMEAKLNLAIEAERNADKAVAAYDSFVFSSIGRQFDAFKADCLALDAAEACGKASRLTIKAGRNGKFNAERAAEFKSIAGA